MENKKYYGVQNSPKFAKLSKRNKKRVLSALRSGRVYLSDKTNGGEALAGVHYTTDHTGKMRGLTSVSTSVLDNTICAARRMDRESICAHCFAAAQMGLYKNMQPVFANNLNMLSSRLLEPKEIPVILTASGYLRGESFGDVMNAIQAANYLRIAKYNPWCKFAVWTKNPGFYDAAIIAGLAEKPANCNIILSSRRVNHADDVPERFRYFIDRVFTVYDPAGIKAQSININCGARSCATCGKCYEKTDKYYQIAEKLK